MVSVHCSLGKKTGLTQGLHGTKRILRGGRKHNEEETIHDSACTVHGAHEPYN